MIKQVATKIYTVLTHNSRGAIMESPQLTKQLDTETQERKILNSRVKAMDMEIDNITQRRLGRGR